ncbi:hypothetical protein Taro_049371 [Colocasia esculenta]|uniref:Uncharacterized protein n=1 Tax=Colocasia esculenta TaxID=4460 RepID=A0A843XAS6_COLES|nr:hypothetical protein [Colocasia esculenta]
MQNWSGSVDTSSSSVDTMLQIQGKMIKWCRHKIRSSSVDTRSGGVDTRDPSQNTFRAKLGQCVDTRSGSVDTRGLPRTPLGLFWDNVSTLDQLVSTLEVLPEQNI